jgi:hypothetical protein
MCDDLFPQGPDRPQELHGAGDGRSGLSRRNFIHGTAAVAAGAALLRGMPKRLPLHSPARPVTADGSNAYSMAMHIHSSFSEQSGSMHGQIYQAALNNFDVLWWTDHDTRMLNLDDRDTVHFTSLTQEKGATGQGGAWIWQKKTSGSLASSSTGGIVQEPCSPNDPVVGGSLHLAAQSTSTSAASYGYYANCKSAGWNYRGNLTGQSVSIDVLLNSGWSNGYFELLISTSYHPASGGRPAGFYSLSYQFVPAGGSPGRAAQGNTGVITIPVAPAGSNPWYTATVTPSNDIAALWPDLDYRDFAMYGITLNAVSTGDAVSGYFDYMNFDRSLSGEVYLQQQTEMMSVLASQYPSVTQLQGMEISRQLPHCSWFGNNVVMTDYGHLGASNYREFLATEMIPQIHAASGLVSYNHPFGYVQKPVLPGAQQDELVSQVATGMLPSGDTPGALGCDILEIGYRARSGVDTQHHIDLWDVMSRNAIFLTGNGPSDDHYGMGWTNFYNNWLSWTWAASTGMPDLLAALSGGRMWSGSLVSFHGSLDLLVDGSCPMGSVSVSTVSSRQLQVDAAKLPSNSTVQVLQGDVDYAGTSGLSSNAQVIASYPSSEFGSGSVTMPVDNSESSFVRTQVLNSSGVIVAASNPAWLLTAAPPNGIPTPRQA